MPVDEPSIATPKRPSTAPTQRSPRCCRTCGRPRKGHPAKGCPYGPPTNTDELADTVDRLHSLRLEPAVTPEPSPVKGHGRRRSSPLKQTAQHAPLEALSPASSELMNDLLAPGILGNELKDGDVDRQLKGIGERMEKLSATPAASPRRSLARQPAAILSPSNPSKSPTRTRPQGAATTARVLEVKAEDEPPAMRSLSRSMSEEERSDFTDALAKTSDGQEVTVYVLQKDVVRDAERRARELGLYTKVLPIAKDASRTKLVLGRDENAVQAVADDAREKSVGVAGRVPVAAGAALFGAAVTLAGLAYS